jgi:hypothetical protein
MHIQPAFLPRIHILLNALGHYYNSLYDYTYFNLHSVETHIINFISQCIPNRMTLIFQFIHILSVSHQLFDVSNDHTSGVLHEVEDMQQTQ